MSVALGVLLVVEDVEVEYITAPAADVPVTEIPPQQFDVGRSIELAALAERAGGRCVLLAARLSAALVLASPPTDGLDRHSVKSCIVRVAHPGVRRSQCAVHDRLRTHVDHEPRLPDATDNSAGCGIRTHKSFRTMVFETIAYASSANPAGGRPNRTGLNTETSPC